MDWILTKLEWLSKYGFIDIIIGIGIFTFIAKILKPKTKSDIPQIDFLPYVDITRNLFSLSIKNQSNEPLYLYRAYLKPGYYTEKINKTNLWTLFKSTMLMTWINDKFPIAIDSPLTTKGFYILQTNNSDGLAPTIFIEPYRFDEFILEYAYLINENDRDPNDLIKEKKFGTLFLDFVHGTRSGRLVMKL